MIVYLDLDRTLFQTSRTPELWEAIAELYPSVEPGAAFAARDRYYHYVGDQYYYDMSAQLSDLGLESEAVYARLQSSKLADGRFEFEYCPELIQSLTARDEVRIFTFGTDDYQRFKASLCPSLQGLSIMTTLRAKSEVLDDSQEECWLVDDKPIGDELPGNVSFVQVALDESVVVPDASWQVFHDLDGVREFFEVVL